MNDLITKALADELKLMRNEKGLSQQELADRMKTTRSRLNNYERGVRDVPLDIFFKYCDICGTDAYEILDKVRKYVYK